MRHCLRGGQNMKKLTAIALALFMAVSLTPIKAEENAGWRKEEGTYYYYENNVKKTGWFKVQNCWYYLDSATGAMKTGWVADNEYWYFMGKSGVMQTNTWIESNGNRYFIQDNGIMAADTVKDGYELDSDGKAIPLSESKSELYDSNIDYSGKVIEGNLYINAENKEVELKNVTIKNKLVVFGEKQAEIKVNLIDSAINTISFQQKNIEITLSGETTVKNVLFEEGGSIKKDKDYKGSIENITIRSAVKQSVEIDVSAKRIEVNNYAGCIIKSKADELILNRKSEVQFNARVKNVIVSDKAKDSILTISRSSTITELIGNAPFKADGEGTVNTLFANAEGIEFGEDLYLLKVVKGKGINDAPKIQKRPVSTSSINNDKEDVPSEIKSVTTDEDFISAIEEHIDCKIPKGTTISLENNAPYYFEVSNQTIIVEGTLNLDGQSLEFTNDAVLKINKGEIKFAGANSIRFLNKTTKLVYIQDDKEYVLQFSNGVGRGGTITLATDGLIIDSSEGIIEDLNALTKFGSLFEQVQFIEYPNTINLNGLKNIVIEFNKVDSEIQLQGSNEERPITIIKENKSDNAVDMKGVGDAKVFYNELGLLDTIWIDYKAEIYRDLGAKLIGSNNDVTLKVIDCEIDVSKSDFYDGNVKKDKIDSSSPTFRWEDDKWVSAEN